MDKTLPKKDRITWILNTKKKNRIPHIITKSWGSPIFRRVLSLLPSLALLLLLFMDSSSHYVLIPMLIRTRIQSRMLLDIYKLFYSETQLLSMINIPFLPHKSHLCSPFSPFSAPDHHV